MLELTSEDDLNRLVEDEIQESLTLEYKRSEALGRSSAQRDELSKDVSALANSAGGQLIYGIREENHLPVEVDGGVDNAVITREWIEQVLNSNIQPRLSKLIITPIKIADQRFAYVITVPASSTGRTREWVAGRKDSSLNVAISKSDALAYPRPATELHLVRIHKPLETLEFREPYRIRRVQSSGEK
jgi:predicted HTH transcriptional regulator